MCMNILFCEEPRFEVDLNKYYTPPPVTEDKTVLQIALSILSLAFWKTTLKDILGKNFPTTLRAKAYVPSFMNSAHLYTNNHKIPTNHINENVKVKDLQSWIPTEDHDLIQSLNAFITNVEKRIPFLGTPPADNKTDIDKFYTQIEDGVRYLIDASNQEICLFQKEAGTDISQYTKAQNDQYLSILQDRVRIARQIAEAGQHCGTRYALEVMMLYNIKSGNAPTCSLRDSIINTLAEKRLQLVRQLIKEDYRAEIDDNVHIYAEHFSKLGNILGLPATKNLVEHLSNELDVPDFLVRFFRKYTEDCIIETIQKQFRDSAPFRSLVTDWILAEVEKTAFLPPEVEKTLPNTVETIKIFFKKPNPSYLEFQKEFGFDISKESLLKLEEGALEAVRLALEKNLRSGISEHIISTYVTQSSISPELMEWLLVSLGILLPKLNSTSRNYSQNITPPLSIIHQPIISEFNPHIPDLRKIGILPKDTPEWLLGFAGITVPLSETPPDKAHLHSEQMASLNKSIENHFAPVNEVIKSLNQNTKIREKLILDATKALKFSTGNSLRYQPKVDLDQQFFSALFDFKVTLNPEIFDTTIDLIPGFHHKCRTFFCIQLPNALSSAMNRRFIRMAFTIFIIYYSYKSLNTLFLKSTVLTQPFTNRIICKIPTNLLEAIRIISSKVCSLKKIIKFLLYTLRAIYILSKKNVSNNDAIVRLLKLFWLFYRFPWSLHDFAVLFFLANKLPVFTDTLANIEKKTRRSDRAYYLPQIKACFLREIQAKRNPESATA